MPLLKDRSDAWKDTPQDKQYKVKIPAMVLKARKEGHQFKFYVPKEFSEHIRMETGKLYWIVIHEA